MKNKFNIFAFRGLSISLFAFLFFSSRNLATGQVNKSILCIRQKDNFLSNTSQKVCFLILFICAKTSQLPGVSTCSDYRLD
jgi:hypothetical protein